MAYIAEKSENPATEMRWQSHHSNAPLQEKDNHNCIS